MRLKLKFHLTVLLLLQEVMTRMESDLGRDLVSSALSLLVCARDGLEAGELHNLLTLLRILGNDRPKVKEILNMRPSPEECLPSATFAKLQRAIAGFLNPTQTLTSKLSLAHADINNAVKQRYFKSSAAVEIELFLTDCSQELKSFRGHADSVTDVCFAGRDKLCSASLDNVVSIWDVENGHRLFALKRHQRWVNSCTFDLSGKLLATASWDCMIKMWSVKKGEAVFELKVLQGYKSSVRDVAYSPSGRHIASAAPDGDVKLWAAYAGSQVDNIHGHALPTNELIFSPTGKELITISDDHKIKVWSSHLGQPISALCQEDLGSTMSVSISPSRETVAVGYHTGYIRIYAIFTGKKPSH